MSTDQQAKKLRVAAAAVEQLTDGLILGVGTGSTVNAFIDLLGPWASRLQGAVSSSEASSQRLAKLHIPILDLNEVTTLQLYIDGADEATRDLHLIKGGGAALTREKIVAATAQRFVCIVDESKVVKRLGRFPLPVEVIPLSRAWVARQLAAMGGRPVWREGIVTDNGNHILDVHDLVIADPVGMEAAINQIVGVVTNGLFAARPADLLLIATDTQVQRIERSAYERF